MDSKRFFTMFVTIFLISLLAASTATSSLTSNLIIGNSGTILPLSISPLHVEGRYIKDANGNIIYLRGVNKVGYEACPGGSWMGRDVMDISQWNPNNCAMELDAMKSWGVNVIRTHIAVNLWKFNIGNMRELYKQMLLIAANKGIYVIFDGYSVMDYFSGNDQDPLPFPPYQTSPGAESIIANQQQFVDWWVSVATELKNYPNVLFELWNEPHPPQGYDWNLTFQTWVSVAQACINAIRAVGANQLIIFQWDYACWVNLDYPPPNNPASTMQWIWQAGLTDPLGYIVYSTHLYPCYGTIHHSIPYYWNAWNYSEIKSAFNYFLFPQVVENYPLLIGEIGPNMALTGIQLQQDLEALDNHFKLFNEMGIHYAAFWWRDIGIHRLHDGPPNFVPNAAGQILKNRLLHQT
ncbi:MAG: cellulase family glycosylhydrolase [Candidatus Jordarchaeaceae archaeon]